MSELRIRGASQASGYRPYHPGPRNDFYDDHSSRSKSPEQSHNSPDRRRSPPYDYNRRNRSRSPYRRYEERPTRRDYSDRSSPPRRRGRDDYEDRDRPRSRIRSHSRSDDDRPQSRGRASKEIIMEGLAIHLAEHDITTELKEHYHVEGLDDVRVIRDRQTRQSRQFGFLRFSSISEAENFMDKHYPTIYLYGKTSTTNARDDEAKVQIHFGRERKDAVRGDEGDWVCKVCNINNYSTRPKCFRCQTARPDPAQITAKATNIGDNDAAADNTPSQFLLLRGLESTVNEELLVKGVSKLNKPASSGSETAQVASKKGAKVASTTGDANLGAKDGTLRRVLLIRDRKTNESWRFGFAEYASIEDAQAALTRFSSFEKFTIASKQVLVNYIHAGVFVPVLNPSASTERFSFSSSGNPSLKLAYWDEDAYVTELVVNAPEPAEQENKPALDAAAKAAEAEGLKALKDTEKTKKRKAQGETSSVAKKPAPSHLQFWSNRHAELHGIAQNDGSRNGSENGDDSADGAPPSRSFADPKRNCCYLCMRQFNNTAELNKHERLSDLHRQNLKLRDKVKRAIHKLEKHGVDQQSSTQEYRDRARERRKAYGVVNKKGEQVGPEPKASRQAVDEERESKPVQSKGAALLSKMGYTAGQGLGASGQGRAETINQDVYVAGVGLGAAGGKLGDAVTEADRNTKSDYGAFVEQSREKARERYARMG